VVRVKICGITTPEDAAAAADAGASAIGVNLVDGPRRVSVDAAAEIVRALPPFCTAVALVAIERGNLAGDVFELLGSCWISQVQCYGDVSPDAIARLRLDGMLPLIVQPVVPGRFPDDVDATLAAMPAGAPAAVVLDAHQPGRLGGTGQTTDWEAIAAARRAGRCAHWPPIILAGGLNPDNVRAAIDTVQPWGVDVSSGVEKSVGRKDPARMRAFVAAARSV